MRKRSCTLLLLSVYILALLTACGDKGVEAVLRNAAGQPRTAQTLHGRIENGEEIQCLEALLEEILKQRAAEEAEKAKEAAERMEQNEAYFYKLAQEQGMEKTEASGYFQILCTDGIFQEGALELTDIVIGDIDQNGEKDMLAMVCGPHSFYGDGGGNLRLYINGKKTYHFQEEGFPYHFRLETIWEDIDNDGRTELAIQTHGIGNGGTGDWYQLLLKYKDEKIETMKLPSDCYLESGNKRYEYKWGVEVEVYQEPQKNTFSAYSPYLNEAIFFQSDNRYGEDPPLERKWVGGGGRGYYDMRCVKYEGKNAIEVSEYLFAGAIVDCVGVAKFLIVWDADGTGYIVKWWIDTRAKDDGTW